MKERRVGAVASLPLERGRALGWGRSPFLWRRGWGCWNIQAEGLAPKEEGVGVLEHPIHTPKEEGG